MNAIRVVLAEDSRPLRKTLRRFFEKSPQIEVVAEAATGKDALSCIQEHHPDVLVLDIQLPEMDGVSVLREISKKKLPVKTLAWSAHDERQFVEGVLRSGATGYLVKDDGLNELAQAIKRAARGESNVLSPRAAALIES